MSYFTKRTARIVGGTLVGALALSVSPILGLTGIASAADPLPPVAEPIGDDNFCEDSPTTEPFTDVTAADPSFDEIVCLVATGLTKGTTPTTYSPNGSITRRQMALFIKRLADKANALDTGTQVAALPAYDGTPDFADIAAESAEVKEAVGQLNQASVVQGTTATTYSPGANVTRRQMAAFINRLEQFLTGAAFSTTKDFFNDDNGDTGEANLNAVASVGIFQGDGAGNVFPGANLTRRQMANILLRHAQVMLDQGDIKQAFPEDDGNQTFTVTGAAATAPFGAAGARTCSVAVPAGTVVDVALIPSEDVTGTGTLLFADPNSDEIYVPAAVEPEIIAINGAPVGPADQINNVTSTGTVAVTFGEVAGGDNPDDVTLLVFADPAAGSNTLNLTDATPNNANPKAPSEQFGTGCRTFFVPAEAALGASTATTDLVNRDLDYFVDTQGTDTTYNWDSNDVFQFQGIGITQVQFEGVLSSNDDFDTLAVTYNPDAAGVSTFNITTDQVGDPIAGTATVVNLDTGATINDVRVTFTPDPDNGPGTVFDIVADNAIENDQIDPTDHVLANNVTCTPSATGECTLTFNNLPNGNYDILIRAENPATTQVSDIDDTNVIDVPGTPDTAGPLAIDTVITTNAGLGGTLDTGDVFKVVFNEALGAPVAGDSIRATDEDGATDTIADFVNGTNATFALNAAAETVNGVSRPASTVLTVTLTAAPTTVQAGLIAGLQIPATITDQSGTADAVGNLWSIAAANQDLVIDQDATDAQNNSLDTAAPTATSNDVVATNTTQTITFNEAINPATLTCADITTDSTETCTGIVMNGANTVATVTYSDALEAGDDLTLAANSVTDVAGNTGPAAALNEAVA